MVIEKDSRWFVIQAIQLDKELRGLESHHLQTNSEDALKSFLCKISEINSVANVNGKGRDDLGLEIYQKAKEILSNQKINSSLAKPIW